MFRQHDKAVFAAEYAINSSRLVKFIQTAFITITTISTRLKSAVTPTKL